MNRQWWTSLLASFCTVLLLLSACVGPAPARRRSTPPIPPGFMIPEDQLGGVGDPVFPRHGNPGYDAVSYDWHLEVDPEANTLSATATMSATALEGRDWVSLDFSGPAVESVELDGQPARFVEAEDKLVVEADLAPNEEFEVTVSYAGTPEPHVGGIEGERGWKHRSGLVYTASLFPGDTSSWVPMNDTPRDPATYRLRITTSDPYVATASGRLVGTHRDRDGTSFVWEVEIPVSEVAFAVGEFERHSLQGSAGLPIDLALPTRGLVKPAWFKPVPEMIGLLSRRLGPFPFPSLGITWTPDPDFDGDATPGRIHLSVATQDVLVHEVAHQWMGGAVGNASQRDAWPREGIPTYAEMLWLEHTEGGQAVRDQVAEWTGRLGASTRPPLHVDDPADRIDDVTFLRGALMLHALRQRLGDDVFFASLQAFFERHGGRSATTQDFTRAVEKVAGQSLDGFFAAWLEREPVPPLDPEG